MNDYYAPSCFVSHGAPTLAFGDGPTQRFLCSMGSVLKRVRAVVVISAHHECETVEVSSAPAHQAVYDFAGFSPALYHLRYDAPGSPSLAAQIARRLSTAGIDCALNPLPGLDHGAWVPLRYLFPDADMPIVRVSLAKGRSAEFHMRMGRTLSPLRRKGVLVLCSGSLTHNLKQLFDRPRSLDEPPPNQVSQFQRWFRDRVEKRDVENLVQVADRAPHYAWNHPTPEHLMPFYVALGAARNADDWRTVHAATSYGVLGMDAFAFADRGFFRSLQSSAKATSGTSLLGVEKHAGAETHRAFRP